MSEAGAPVIALRRARKHVPGTAAPRLVLADVELVVARGEMVSIVGPSGAGKTTILNILSGLDVDFEGQLLVHGEDVRALDDDRRTRLRGLTMGFVFQSFQLLEHLSVEENVRLPLWLGSPLSLGEEAARAEAALARVGLGGRGRERVGPLSGGERQRVAIARAIVHRPELVLADEPTGNLDAETAAGIYAIFDELKRTGAAVVVATHDRALAARADRSLALVSGRLEAVP